MNTLFAADPGVHAGWSGSGAAAAGYQQNADCSPRDSDGPGPYGSKGMSEGALLCVAPAVAAAVRDATGAVIRDLPLTPERVWRALQAER